MKMFYQLTFTPLSLSIYRTNDHQPEVIGARGAIGGFSEGSARRLKAYLTSCEAKYQVMATFTLPSESTIGKDPVAFKSALDDFLSYYLKELREGADGLAASLCWFLEFTTAGVPHVHIFATGFVQWFLLAFRWCEVMGCPEALETCSKVERINGGRRVIRRYATKYACKGMGATLSGISAELGISAKGVDDLALWKVVVETLKAKGDKRYQKLVPPWCKGFGRFWGVRGLRASLAATIKIAYNAQNKAKVINFLHILLHSKTFKAQKVRRMQRVIDVGMVLIPLADGWDAQQTAQINLGMAQLLV